jgi:alpha/beta superfamily hydrolase
VLSRDRFEDVSKLLARVKQDLPGVKKVWVVGHSFGSHSSASVARYGEGVIDGAIHTAAVLYGQGDYRLLAAWDFSAARVPQLFIHHRNDSCPATPYSRTEYVANRYKIPLVTITQASGMKGDRCQAFMEHGFMGAEQVLMDTIYKAVEGGVDQFKH